MTAEAELLSVTHWPTCEYPHVLALRAFRRLSTAPACFRTIFVSHAIVPSGAGGGFDRRSEGRREARAKAAEQRRK